MDLTGNAFVTGAASGIGQEVAFLFAERGARSTIIADVNLEEAQKTATKSKSFAKHPQYEPFAVHIDVTNRSSIDQAVAEAVRLVGRLDYCVNSAGVGPAVNNPITQVSEEDYDRLNSVNNKGILFTISAVAEVMMKQNETFVEGRSGRRGASRGAIVNVTSRSSFNVISGFVQYAASKHAAMAVTKTAALELQKQRIRVNAVCPTFTDTAMVQAQIDRQPELREMMEEKSPLGRLATPEEVAGAAYFLCSPDSSYVNGESLIIDAGGSLSSFP